MTVEHRCIINPGDYNATDTTQHQAREHRHYTNVDSKEIYMNDAHYKVEHVKTNTTTHRRKGIDLSRHHSKPLTRLYTDSTPERMGDVNE